MSDVEISCPRCAHRLRVPTNLLGEDVQCPQCESTFTAPVQTEGGTLSEPVVASGDATEPYTRQQALIQVRRPGIALLLVGLFGTLGHGYALWQLYANPQEAEARSRFLFEAGQIEPKDEGEVEPPAFPLKEVRIMGWVSVVLSSLMILGGIATLTLRGFPIAILGSLAGALNIGGCCCLLGGPIGVWCFANLIDQDVKQHFKW